MSEPAFKYDVAFSFLDKDLNLALEISRKLSDNIASFVYSERQAELAGKEGEETINRVYGEEARIVLVLYRNGWGESTWTRIEKTAIQNRSLVQGYDFTIFVLVDDKPTPPPWLPKTRLWVNYPKFGIDGITATLENRVQETGGNATPLTLEERTARTEASLAALRRRT